MKKICFITIIISLILVIAHYFSTNSTRNISKVLNVDLSSGTVSKNEDSHGGFHGDGTAYTEIKGTLRKKLAEWIEKTERMHVTITD